MKKIKQILFIATFPPPVHGSAMVSQYIRESKLINEAFECDYVNLSTSRRMDEIGKKNPVKIWRLFSALLLTFWKLLTHRYDLCYLAITCHGNGFLKDSPFVLLCRMFRKKIIIHQHNKGMANDVDRWPYRWLLPLCYKNAKVILLSWRLYPDIEKVVPKENVMICPNGIPETVIGDPLRSDNAVPRLLFLSNLLIEKGVLVLLDALKILKDRGYSFVCDFVGGETTEIDATKFETEVRKRILNDKVVFHGKKYGTEKRDIFSNADIFIFPTYYHNECFPLVLLEAMQYGKPCISTNEGGILDIVKNGENGLIAERRNAESLSDCIQKLLDNPELCRQMGENGRKKFHEHFTNEVFERTMVEIINGQIIMNAQHQ